MNIVLYGDSNTYGYSPDGKRYENRFSNILKNKYKNYNIYEEGLVGRTTIYNDPRENRKAIDNIKETLNKYENIDLFIIMLGTNDYKINNASNLDDVKSSMDKLLNVIIESNIIKKLLIISPIALSKDIAKLDDNFNYNSYLLSLNSYKAYEELAKKYNALFFDAKDIASPGIDGEHLNIEGHLAIANKLIDIIDDLK
jgi:lysophospholipase L1-like esterase